MLLQKLITTARCYSPCMNTDTKRRHQREDDNVKGCEEPYFGTVGLHDEPVSKARNIILRSVELVGISEIIQPKYTVAW